MRIFLLILILILNIINLSFANNNKLPNLGNESQLAISPREEVILGKTIIFQLQLAGLIYSDAITNAYINHLGNHLLANTTQIDFNKFNFFIVNEAKEINAFAFFGGNIGVFPGLINLTSSESELAAILAHEISHLTQKHHARYLSQQKKLTPITIAGAIAGSIVNPYLGVAILGLHHQHGLNFSREHEKEADRIGIQVLTHAGFNPAAMPTMFQKFNMLNDNNHKIPEYLLTHPMFESRIADTLSRINTKQYKQFQENPDYHLIKARIIVNFSDNTKELLSNIESNLKQNKYNNYIFIKYKQALLLQNMHQYDKALMIFQELVNKNPDNIILQLSLTDLELTLNKPTTITKLANLIKLYPDYFPLILSYAKALLNNKKYLTAINLLNTYDKDSILEFINMPEFYQLLMASFQGLNQTNEAMITQAKLLIITNHIDAALQKLKIATKTANPKQLAKIKILQADLKEFK